MRWTCRLALVAALLLGGPWAGGPAAADEDPPPGASALEQGLAALRLRMQAKLLEAQLLEQAGKIEEALAATREVERLYREGLADLQRLLASQPQPPRLPRVERPEEESDEAPDEWPAEEPAQGGMPRGITPEPDPFFGEPTDPPGRAFRGRGGARPRGVGMVTAAEKRRSDAVLHALRWLAAHQSADGGWECEGFAKWCDGKANTGQKPDGTGKPMYDAGVTGLALCAFLGAGYTHRGDHEFAKVVRKGLSYLKNVQDPEGCFGPRSTQHYIYNHACAALAMVEAYGMTGAILYRGSAQKALDFIALARNPYFGWRYGVKPGDNDSSVTGWMVMVLKSARMINADDTANGKPHAFTIDEQAFEGARHWFDKMTDPDYGRVGYVTRGSGSARPQELVDRFPGEKSEAMTALGMLVRTFHGADPTRDALVQKGAALCAALLPTWNPNDGSIDMVYWYYATLALHQVGGAAWERWRGALDTAIVANQRLDGTYCGFKGSWDPVDPWSPDGGRVYATAMLAMCCEAEWRYARAVETR